MNIDNQSNAIILNCLIYGTATIEKIPQLAKVNYRKQKKTLVSTDLIRKTMPTLIVILPIFNVGLLTSVLIHLIHLEG